ncbi:MAG: AI-2E family transporter [Candidatus Limnocylindria bacterium]
MDLSPRDRTLVTAALALLVAFLAVQVAAAVIGALALIADVLLVFLVSWAVAYLLVPLVDKLERRARLGRLGAVAVVYAAIFVVLAVVLAFGVPAIAGQLAALADRAPEFGEEAEQIVIDLQDQLEGAGIPVDIEGLYGSLPGRLGDLTGAFAADALSIVAATGVLVFNTGLVLIIAFFMLLDGDRLWDRFTGLLSPELHSEAELFRQSADRSFGGFIRASLLLGLIYGVGMLLILASLGVPFAGLLALASGLLMVIPFFGPFIAVIPVFATTVLGAADRFLLVFVLTMAMQQLILSVIGPRVMANVIGIHPLFVFFALLVGARLAGFWGVLLAMPLAGIANTFARYVYQVTQGRRTREEADRLIIDREAPPGEITVARQ